MNNKIRVLVVEPGKHPYTKVIHNDLESLQREVDGFIEVIYPFEDSISVICNEEGKLNGLPLNRSLHDNYGAVYDIICGTFLVVGLKEDDFTSLTDQQVEKFIERFYPVEYWGI